MYLGSIDKPMGIVFGSDINGLGVIRSLGRKKIPVLALDFNPKDVGMFSKYAKKMICPNINKSEGQFIDFLLEVGEQMNYKGILFPTDDDAVLAILRYRDKLEKYFDFSMATLDVIGNLLLKDKLYNILEKNEVPHPKTYLLNNVSELEYPIEKVKYPCFIKPVYSMEFARKFHAKGFYISNKKELISVLNNLFKKCACYDVMIQDVIPGAITNLHGFYGYFNKKSELLTGLTYRKIRQFPIYFGTGCLVESIWKPEIVELATQFLQGVNYHGLVDVEFKLDPRDNKFKLIEINTRTGALNIFSTKCGINLPYTAYLDAIGKDIEVNISKKEGVKGVYVFYDILSAVKSMSKGKLSPIDWINSLRGEKEYAIFAWDDPLPFLVSPLNLSSAVLRYLLRCLQSYVKSMKEYDYVMGGGYAKAKS